MFMDMHVSGVRVLVKAFNYGSPLNHSELTMESKCRGSKLGEYSFRTVENGLQNLLFIVIKTSSLITTRKLGLKMLEHPDAPLVQIERKM